MRVVEGGEQSCLARESCLARAVRGVRGKQDLQRDVPVEREIPGPEDLAHAPGTEWADDFIGTDTSAGRKGGHLVRTF